jgi:hypothetical protein
LALGAQLTLNNHLTGDIAEVKLYGAALSDSERVAEENALICKYGLGLGLPPAAALAFSATAASRQVFLNWLPIVGASGYKVSWSDSYTGPYTQLAGNLTTNSFVHTNPAMGRTNYYRVAAYSACGTGTLTDPSAVFLPIPSVSVRVNTNSLTLAWPDWASDWRLWWATNLTPPVTWWTVTNPVSISGGQITVTLPFRWGAEFFRLSNP